MSVLYVAEQGAVLRRVSQRLVVSKGGEDLEERAAFLLERVLVFGNVQITTQAMAMLLENGTELSLFSTNGRLRGTLSSPAAHNVLLRLAQFDAWRNGERRVQLGRSFVVGKLRNQRAVLQRYRRNRGLKSTEAEDTLARLILEAAQATDLKNLMGLEGLGGRVYFQMLRQVFPPEVGFNGRKRRPPPDPANALLSLGYSLLGTELGGLLEGLAFDPHLGFLHGVSYGRLSLALDLLEEFRSPVVDVFTAELLNKGVFRVGDFTEMEGEQVHLRPEALRRYFVSYEAHLRGEGRRTEWRIVMRQQAEKLRRCVFEGEEYEPYAWQ